MVKKNSGKAPSYQRYPNDWLSDAKLRQAPFYAKGVWADLIELSYGMPIKGVFAQPSDVMTDENLLDFCNHFYAEIGSDFGSKSVINLFNIEPFSERNLMEILTGNEAEKRRGLRYVLDKQIMSITADGIFYCKRMYKDMRLRWIRKNVGKMGGNPNLKADSGRNLDNQSRRQKSTPSSSSSSSTSVIKETNREIRDVEGDDYPPRVDHLSLSMSPDYSALSHYWKKGLGQVLDVNSKEGLRMLVDLGQPVEEVKQVLRTFLEEKKKAKPGDWLATCTLKGLAKGQYQNFVKGEKKKDGPILITAIGECPKCKKDTTVLVRRDTKPFKRHCMHPGCDGIVEVSVQN